MRRRTDSCLTLTSRGVCDHLVEHLRVSQAIMAAFGTHFAQIAAVHQHATRAAHVPTQLTSLAGSLHAPRSVAAATAQCRQRGLPVVQAVAATERPTGMQRPDAAGRFGKYGGKYVPETLITALAELEAAYAEIKNDVAFQVSSFRRHSAHSHPYVCPHDNSLLIMPLLQSELAAILRDYVGRESPLYHADRLSEHFKK